MTKVLGHDAGGGQGNIRDAAQLPKEEMPVQSDSWLMALKWCIRQQCPGSSPVHPTEYGNNQKNAACQVTEKPQVLYHIMEILPMWKGTAFP